MSHFPRCIDRILAEEGGLSHHPRDPGGLTKFGISQRTYPDLDIRHLTRAQARAIYQRDFWQPLRADDLPPGLDLLVLDRAVIEPLTLLGAGALVTPGQRLTGAALWVGTPAQRVRSLSDQELEYLGATAANDIRLAQRHRASLAYHQ